MAEEPEDPHARTPRQREVTASWQHGLKTRRGWRRAEVRRQAEAEQATAEAGPDPVEPTRRGFRWPDSASTPRRYPTQAEQEDDQP